MVAALGVVTVRDIPDSKSLPHKSGFHGCPYQTHTLPHTHTHSLTLYMYTTHTSYTWNSHHTPHTLTVPPCTLPHNSHSCSHASPLSAEGPS